MTSKGTQSRVHAFAYLGRDRDQRPDGPAPINFTTHSINAFTYLFADACSLTMAAARLNPNNSGRCA